MQETDSVDVQVKLLTENFLLALNSRAAFEMKLTKRPPARWITKGIKNKIKKKNILSHEYKSIMDDAAKCRKKKNTNDKNDRSLAH